jgi:hypothetical protein
MRAAGPRKRSRPLPLPLPLPTTVERADVHRLARSAPASIFLERIVAMLVMLADNLYNK